MTRSDIEVLERLIKLVTNPYLVRSERDEEKITSAGITAGPALVRLLETHKAVGS